MSLLYIIIDCHQFYMVIPAIEGLAGAEFFDSWGVEFVGQDLFQQPRWLAGLPKLRFHRE